MKKILAILSTLVLVSLVLSACGAPATPVATEPPPPAPTATEAPPTEPPAPAWEAPEGALVAYPVDAAPTLDGIADDAAWANAQELVIPVAGGFNNFGTDGKLKAAYSGDTVYFVLTYADPTESWFRSPWQKQEDGTWKKVTDPNDKGGDNNSVYEDKFAMIWSINNSIKNFETTGCFVACHAGENSDKKPYGNKYTSAEGEFGDIWHWKSIRNLGQIDDQYLDSTRYDAEKAVEAGRKSDKKDSGGYADNYASMPDPADSTKTVPEKLCLVSPPRTLTSPRALPATSLTAKRSPLTKPPSMPCLLAPTSPASSNPPLSATAATSPPPGNGKTVYGRSSSAAS